MACTSFNCHDGRYFFPVPFYNMSPHSAAVHCPYLSTRFILPVMNKKVTEEEHVPDNYSAETYNSWKYSLVVDWSCHDVLFWVINQLCELGVKNVAAVKLEHFDGINGTTLKHLSLYDFRRLIPEYGDDLYLSLQYRLSYEARVWKDLTVAPGSFVQKVYIPLEVVHKPQSTFRPQDVDAGLDLSSASVAEKRIDSWSASDTLQWLLSQLVRLGVKDPAALRLEHFNHTSGQDLVRLSLAEFKQRIPSHADQLYHQLQVKIQAETQFTDTEIDLSVHHRRDVPECESEGERKHSSVKRGKESSNGESKGEKFSSLKENVQPTKITKKTKAQEREKVGRVWEFIRELLLDSRYRDVISWVDREAGIFRFENSAKAAKLWGDRKGNTFMNFKKFSRAIRYNYKMGYLSGVKKNRLIYKFGPKSHGWKLQNT